MIPFQKGQGRRSANRAVAVAITTMAIAVPSPISLKDILFGLISVLQFDPMAQPVGSPPAIGGMAYLWLLLGTSLGALGAAQSMRKEAKP